MIVLKAFLSLVWSTFLATWHDPFLTKISFRSGSEPDVIKVPFRKYWSLKSRAPASLILSVNPNNFRIRFLKHSSCLQLFRLLPTNLDMWPVFAYSMGQTKPEVIRLFPKGQCLRKIFFFKILIDALTITAE